MLQKTPTPANRAELKAYLGLLQFYRKMLHTWLMQHTNCTQLHQKTYISVDPYIGKSFCRHQNKVRKRNFEHQPECPEWDKCLH